MCCHWVVPLAVLAATTTRGEGGQSAENSNQCGRASSSSDLALAVLASLLPCDLDSITVSLVVNRETAMLSNVTLCKLSLLCDFLQISESIVVFSCS